MRVRLLTENDTLPMFKNDNGVILNTIEIIKKKREKEKLSVDEIKF